MGRPPIREAGSGRHAEARAPRARAGIFKEGATSGVFGTHPWQIVTSRPTDRRPQPLTAEGPLMAAPLDLDFLRGFVEMNKTYIYSKYVYELHKLDYYSNVKFNIPRAINYIYYI